MATLAEGASTRTDAERLALRASLVVFFTLLLGFVAQLPPFPLGRFGVPQTMQSLVVILSALHLGPRWGTASMLLYLVVGALGAGVFSDGGAGPAVILGQTGGYIVGFVASQPVVAGIVRRPDGTPRGWGAVVLASLAGHAVVFAIGVPWLYFVRKMDASPSVNALTIGEAIRHGCLIFIPGTVVKTAIAVVIARFSLPWAMRRVW